MLAQYLISAPNIQLRPSLSCFIICFARSIQYFPIQKLFNGDKLSQWKIITQQENYCKEKIVLVYPYRFLHGGTHEGDLGSDEGEEAHWALM